MADRFYGTDRDGVVAPRVTIDTSTTSKVIELRVATAAGITKKDVTRALVRLQKAILEDVTSDEF